MSRPYLTLIGVLGESLLRADFFSGKVPTLRRLERLSPVAGGDLASSLERSLATGARCARKVYVLSTEFTTQTVELMVARGRMSEVETRSALSFEAEAGSGISVAESALGFRAVTTPDGRNLYWVVQTSEAILLTCEEICQRAGSRLMGILHPGGLPLVIDFEDNPVAGNAAWTRVEVWPKELILLSGKPDATTRLSVIPSGSRSVDWRAESRGVFGDLSATPVVWVAPGASVGVRVDSATVKASTVFELSSEATLTKWLTGWARVLGEAQPSVPMIRPPERETPVNVWLGIAAGITAVLGLGLYAHSRWQEAREVQLKEQLVIAREPALALASTMTGNARLETQLKVLTSTNDSVRKTMLEWRELKTLQRHRHAGLLATLAETVPQTVMLCQITDAGKEIIVRGFATYPKLESVINDLDRALAPIGWEVQIPTQEAKGWLQDGGPWAVAFRFTPAGIRPLNTIPLPSGAASPAVEIPRAELPTLNSPLQTAAEAQALTQLERNSNP